MIKIGTKDTDKDQGRPGRLQRLRLFLRSVCTGTGFGFQANRTWRSLSCVSRVRGLHSLRQLTTMEQEKKDPESCLLSLDEAVKPNLAIDWFDVAHGHFADPPFPVPFRRILKTRTFCALTPYGHQKCWKSKKGELQLVDVDWHSLVFFPLVLSQAAQP